MTDQTLTQRAERVAEQLEGGPSFMVGSERALQCANAVRDLVQALTEKEQATILDHWSHQERPSALVYNHAVDVANANYRRAEAAEQALTAAEGTIAFWQGHAQAEIARLMLALIVAQEERDASREVEIQHAFAGGYRAAQGYTEVVLSPKGQTAYALYAKRYRSEEEIARRRAQGSER